MTKDELLIESFPLLLRLVDDVLHAGRDDDALTRAAKAHNARVADWLNRRMLGLPAAETPPTPNE